MVGIVQLENWFLLTAFSIVPLPFEFLRMSVITIVSVSASFFFNKCQVCERHSNANKVINSFGVK